MISSFTLAMGNIGAAKKLHHNLLTNKLHTPQSFFDTTPIGRIINRFSKDIYVIDEALPATVLMLLGTVFVSLSTMIVIISSTPIFAVVIVPLAFIYFFVQVLLKYHLSVSCFSSSVCDSSSSSSSRNGMWHAKQLVFTLQFQLFFLCRLRCFRDEHLLSTSLSSVHFPLSPQPKHPLSCLFAHPKHTHSNKRTHMHASCSATHAETQSKLELATALGTKSTFIKPSSFSELPPPSSGRPVSLHRSCTL